MIEYSKCGFKIPGMILLRIFLQNCSILGGSFLEGIFAYFRHTATVWNINGTPTELTSCFSEHLRYPKMLITSRWTVISEEAKSHGDKIAVNMGLMVL